MKIIGIFLLLSCMNCFAGTPTYHVIKQTSYTYEIGCGYFDIEPVVRFTVKDFTFANETLRKKYGDKSMTVFVVPFNSDQEYTLRIYSDHLLETPEVHKIVETAETIMLMEAAKK